MLPLKIQKYSEKMDPPHKLLYETCQKNDIDAVISITKNSNNWDAKRVQHAWNNGLAGACLGGNREIVDFMIAMGANNLHDGLFKACLGGNRDIIDLMITMGVNNWRALGTTYCQTVWDFALKYACRGGNRDIVNLMIANGASHWNLGLDAAVYRYKKKHNYHLICLMIAKGANYLECKPNKKMLRAIICITIVQNKEKRRQWYNFIVGKADNDTLTYIANHRMLRPTRTEASPLFNVVTMFCCRDIAMLVVANSAIAVKKETLYKI